MISELKTLVAIARFGTFAAAGDRIGLTQAAVSGQMKRLEEKLGVQLFERTGRSATLNAAGLRTLERAKDIIAKFEAIADPADEDSGGRLSIGAIASVQSTVLARALVPFRDRFPKHHIHIVPGISLHLLDLLDAGELDLAVVIKPSFGIPKDFVWQPLLREPYVLAVPSWIEGDDWLALLQEQPFIRYERSSFGGRQVDRFLRSLSVTARESVEIDDISAMAALVGQGLGVALLPMTEGNLPLPPSVRVVSLADRTFYREIGILKPQADQPVTAHLADCLTAAVF
ncbi:LysR substrate-binding domain-containing protein [Agrobacterium sp. SHOUNA12C]|uniref:HTH-type transcriptional regulator TtuA n=1 Tax=Rhizobium rhizogenes NBRC 13257 TaxID=1220581 RepID=A0AA87Q6S7_RHIRH|nr:LysR substrate-binding domain-containing protein [Rhizobium rhizogenes]MCJ9723412.1 LysR substrate-binding domain-containing protein [Agrobacterium sp. BETTINA12B]MCJ9758741.1 LysR substrate-binding domain-containing protein [Agrobacterium sp. SHOUNA12C]OCJ08732.1 LysR family transcriptional regulator [Agrobacterium sp. B131/95]NTF56744.1 LysR family transcriptional regulator [Rhizobium rhizogenes]NTF76325.1 LysR family transcriptional regulator [Rhizobium rhizogenes]